MPDAQGNVTAGQDNVIGGGSPVMPQDQTNLPGGPAGGPVPISGANVPPPAPPTQQPAFFKTLLFALGKGLLEGTRAGLEAPMNAQGPSIAAANAPNIPVQDAQRQAAMAQAKAAPQQIADQATLSKLQVETAQINLAIMQHNLIHIDDARADSYYKEGQGVAANLLEKGNAEPISTGSQADIQQAYLQQRQLHPDDNFMILPMPGGGDKKEYQLLRYNPQDRFSEDGDAITLPEVKGADGSVYPALTIPGPKKGQSIKDWTARATTLGKLQTTRDLDIGRAADRQQKATEGQKNRDMRLKIAELNNALRDKKITADIAKTKDDPELAKAATNYRIAAKNLADAQKPGLGKAWADLTGKETDQLSTARKSYDEAKSRYESLSGKTKPSPNAAKEQPVYQGNKIIGYSIDGKTISRLP